MLVYLPHHPSRIVSAILENQTELVYYLQKQNISSNTEYICNKGTLRLKDILCEHSMTLFGYFTFTRLNLNLVPSVYVC